MYNFIVENYKTAIIILTFLLQIYMILVQYNLKKQDFIYQNLKKNQIDKLQLLYELLVDLNQKNSNLFKSKKKLSHDLLKQKISQWLISFVNVKQFFEVNKMFFVGKIELSIIHDISKLRVLASKLLEEKEDLLHFEEQFENDRNHMYSFEEIEIELIEKSLNIIKKENEILEIIESINKIKENIEIEFRTILGIKKSNI